MKNFIKRFKENKYKLVIHKVYADNKEIKVPQLEKVKLIDRIKRSIK